jgi:hypothetical protein
MNEKIRLGKREKEILNFLENQNGQAWYSDLKDKFVFSINYTKYLRERLYRMEKKGLIKLMYIKNPQTKREKLRVILVKHHS